MRREAREQFEALSEDHWWFRGRRAVYLGLLDRALAGARPARALDLGCGPGGFTAALAERCGRVVAADRELESLRASSDARSLPESSPRVAADATALAFRNGAFDLVCLYDVLEHLDDDIGALVEVHRVLAPDGWVAISVPAYPWLYANNDRISMHRRRYTRRTLASALDRAGFRVERNTHANVLLTPLIVPVTLIAKGVEATFLRGRTSGHTNLSWPLPRFAHGALARVFASELFVTARFDAPFGHSIAALARKR